MNTKRTSANLGAKGWGIVLFGAVAWLVGGAFWANVITNVVLPTFAQNIGTDQATLLFISTITIVIMIPLNFLLGPVYAKFGTRKIMGISLVVTAVGLVLYGHVTSLVAYVIIRLAICFGSASYTQVGMGALCARYFPTKKGFALGWITVGASASNIIGLPIFNFLFGRVGMCSTFYVFAAVVAVLAVINFVCIPDDPAKMGYQPDNGDSDPQVLEAMKVASSSATGLWTRKEALRTKNFWIMLVGHAMLMMLTTGIAMQIVPHMTNNGVSQTTAVMLVSITGIVGMVSSAVSGWVDQKIGPRKTTVIMAVSYACACICLGALPFNNVTLFFGLFFYCAVMGAVSNLPTSHLISVYGSADFTKIYGVFFPIMSIFVAPSSAILGASLSLTGAYNLAYVIFAVCAVIGVILITISADGMEKMPGEKPRAYRLKHGEKKYQRIA